MKFISTLFILLFVSASFAHRMPDYVKVNKAAQILLSVNGITKVLKDTADIDFAESNLVWGWKDFLARYPGGDHDREEFKISVESGADLVMKISCWLDTKEIPIENRRGKVVRYKYIVSLTGCRRRAVGAYSFPLTSSGSYHKDLVWTRRAQY